MTSSSPPPATSITNARFLLATHQWKKVEKAPLPEIAFVGRSNVGKSSLINLLAGQKNLAKTSSTPGRTQAVVLFEAQLRRGNEVIPFHLVDLPGYGYAKVPESVRKNWRPMMESYFRNNRRLACCVFLLDARRVPGDDDLELLEMLANMQVPALPIVTKCDKVPKTKRPAELKKIAQRLELDDWRDLLPVSTLERFGHRELLAELFDIVAEAEQPASSDDEEE